MTRETKSSKGKVKVISISLTPEALAKLEAYCEKHDRGASWVVDKLVKVSNLEKLS